MLNFLVIVHIVVAVLLIILVLLQDSKGGAMGGMMGGSGGASNSLLGPTGGASLAAKATRYMAIIFAATSIGLTVYTSTGGQSSVIDDVSIPVPNTNTEQQDLATPPVEEDAGLTEDETGAMDDQIMLEGDEGTEATE